ncbi:MAG TPA: bifunctional phosphoribosylaminoimidazolecarboxamide formyltransferase/IMP cyclohydrolase [Pseudogracilibacillus sp.]|nr:bifunctional phosphoribosylaminoimidazolecarboxamide formyltransferase/IMP cyclohydrolase [Pseudogracilibacillus sp.]
MTKRALISVSNKDKLVPFATTLVELGYEIISTGGTLKVLQENGVEAVSVSTVTQFPEILDGRVKTLHPNIHGGLLAQRDNPEHMAALQENDITAIDIVVVNLYPFKEAVTKDDATEEDIIENIDIGGPSMLRAAAKNGQDVLTIVDPEDYDRIADSLKQGNVDSASRKKLSAKVFRHTANYDAMIANYFNEVTGETFPETTTMTYEKVQDLRYGENPHQAAAFYGDVLNRGVSLAAATQLHGKELSYNNIQDANAALEIMEEYENPAAIAVKHMNPCGIGIGEDLNAAFSRAYAADPISIFGGIIAVNREVDEATAKQMGDIFLEIVMAPRFSEEALQVLQQKKNIRLLELPPADSANKPTKMTTVKGGVLIQTADDGVITAADVETATEKQPTEQEMTDLLFAWKAVKHVKSNAIVLAKDKQTIGVGAGQMNRIGAANIAIEQAGEKAERSVMASDAFFPMPDTVEAAAKAGVTAIIQPGGSKRDQASVDVCNQHGISMVYTSMRHFKH